MKRLCSLLIMLFLIPTVFSLEIKTSNNFSSQETLIAEIKGEFLEPILNENIFFYRTHVRVPMDFELLRVNNNYYVYALLPEVTAPTNYSLSVKGVRYMTNNKVSEEEVKKSFIINENIADFKINPGVIVTKEDFFIVMQNLKNSELNVEIRKDEEDFEGFFSFFFGSSGNSDSLTFKADEIMRLKFDISAFSKSSYGKIVFSSGNTTYEVPISILIIQSEEEPTEDQWWEVEESYISPDSSNNNSKEEYKPETIKSCSQLKGSVCSKGYSCDGDTTYASDDKCCLGSCVEIKSSYSTRFIGIALIGLVLILLYVIFFRYKSFKPKSYLLKR